MNTRVFRIARAMLHPLLQQFRVPGVSEALRRGQVRRRVPMAGIHQRHRINDTMMAYRAPFPDFHSRADSRLPARHSGRRRSSVHANDGRERGSAEGAGG
jgi:hypothetical protein